MTDHNQNGKADDYLKKISRRSILRNSSIAATGILFMPSIFTACTKDAAPGAVGAEPSIDLEKAAANLRRLRVWVTDLYPLCIEYEDAVFHALASTKQNENWANFIIDIFIDIAVGIADAMALAAGGPAAIPAIACLSAFLHDWGLGKDNRPNNLDDEFAIFEFGHNAMQLALQQKLSSLVDPKNNYNNLVSGWGDKIEFNGTGYTVADLAMSNFPDLGDDYNNLQTAAYIAFKKAIWNLAIMKCCTYQEVDQPWLDGVDPNVKGALLKYVREEFYPKNKGVYLRAGVLPATTRWALIAYNLGINGNPFPDEAAKILFMDDTPGHIINPDGLFNRSYVFEQFSVTKYDFGSDAFVHELGDDQVGDINPDADDWNFVGGMFPVLIK